MSGQSQAPSGKPAIVVTGASSGIGLEIARVAAREGQPIMLVARSEAAFDALAVEFQGAGAEAVALPLDLTAPDAGGAVEAALAARGFICDVLVNNAGFGLAGRAAELPRAEQMRLVDLNC